MPDSNDTQVIIVGAGPTGTLLAIELARRGVAVCVLDKHLSPPQESRAIALHARTLEIFHQLALIEEFVESGHRVDGFAIHTRPRTTIAMRFSVLDSRYPFLLTLSQEKTQQLLDARLKSLGVEVVRGADVLEVHQTPDRIEARVKGPGERRERTIRADWVVGCDGAHSIVRRCLGAAFDGHDYAQDWLMTEVKLDWPLPRDQFHVFAYTPAPLPAFPLPSGRWRLFLPQVPNRTGERETPSIEEIERLVAARGPAGMRLTDPTLLEAFRCYRRSTKTMRRGRMLLAGDAAHVHSPAGGQGMNTGLQDAFNLGWKLALVAHRHAADGLLDTYKAERAPIAAGVLALTHALVRTFTISSPLKRFARDHLLLALTAVPAIERRYMTRLAQLSHSYRGAAFAPNAFHRSIGPGDRLPSVSGLKLDGKPVCTLDLIASPTHTLLILSGERPDPDRVRQHVARFARWSELVRPVVLNERADDRKEVADPGLSAHRRYRAARGRLLLVRPDGYIASSAPLERADRIERYLERLTTPREAAADREYCRGTFLRDREDGRQLPAS